MDEKLKPIFEKLGDEVSELHYRWSIYEEVYAGDAAQTELLNRNGSNFFYYVQHLMLDNVALALSKLTDPSKQFKNENLSLKQIYDYVKASEEDELTSNIKEKLDDLGFKTINYLADIRCNTSGYPFYVDFGSDLGDPI